MITINKEHKEAIKDICKLAKPKASIEILRNVLLIAKDGMLTLKATDMTVELTRSIPVDIESSFETTVNASKFMQAINASTGDVKLIVSDKDVQVKSGRRKFTLPTITSDAYPSYPGKDNMECLDIDSLVFANGVKSVSFAAGKGDVIPMQLNSVCVRDHFFGAISHRMAWLESGLDCDLMIPWSCIAYLPSLSGGKVSYSKNILCISFDDYEFKTVLLDGSYPGVKGLIPDHDKTISANRNLLIDSVKAAMVTANEKSRNITVTFDGDDSSIRSANNAEKSVIGFDCESDERFEVSFNSSYLLDALNALSSDTVKIEYESDLKQVAFKDDLFQSLIMPVRI